MEIKPITHPDFARYGYVVTGYDFQPLLKKLGEVSEKPANEVIYVPGDKDLEALPVSKQMSDNLYGGMPIQVGYCNGSNKTLNCLEYHRGCEIDIATEDIVLLLAPLQNVKDNQLDTADVEAFLLPAGQAALLYETTLHYAPCNGPDQDGFRVIIVLPHNTNTEKPDITPLNDEDKLLWARNKWLLAHPEAPEAAQGAVAGLTGKNITL